MKLPNIVAKLSRNIILLILVIININAHAVELASLTSLQGQPAVETLGRISPESIIVIFNPGTSDWSKPQPCTPTDNPLVIQALDETKILGKSISAYHLCSDSVGIKPGDLTPKRAIEIGKAVEFFTSKGVAEKQIFLAGQSRGGWSALYYASKSLPKIGGTIAFAPAIHGPRPISNREVVIDHINQFKRALNINGLLFSHPKDSFFRPKEHSFALEIDGLELITDICPDLDVHRAHAFSYYQCSSTMIETIQEFISTRIRGF